MSAILAIFTLANLLFLIGTFAYARQAQQCADRAHMYEQNCFRRWLETGALDEPEDHT